MDEINKLKRQIDLYEKFITKLRQENSLFKDEFNEKIYDYVNKNFKLNLRLISNESFKIKSIELGINSFEIEIETKYRVNSFLFYAKDKDGLCRIKEDQFSAPFKREIKKYLPIDQDISFTIVGERGRDGDIEITNLFSSLRLPHSNSITSCLGEAIYIKDGVINNTVILNVIGRAMNINLESLLIDWDITLENGDETKFYNLMYDLIDNYLDETLATEI